MKIISKTKKLNNVQKQEKKEDTNPQGDDELVDKIIRSSEEAYGENIFDKTSLSKLNITQLNKILKFLKNEYEEEKEKENIIFSKNVHEDRDDYER